MTVNPSFCSGLEGKQYTGPGRHSAGRLHESRENERTLQGPAPRRVHAHAPDNPRNQGVPTLDVAHDVDRDIELASP